MLGAPDLSVVIPVWAGEHNLRRLIPSLHTALDALIPRWEVVVAAHEDAADIREAAESLGAAFVGAEGGGYGDVLRAGLAGARGAHVATMDADFSHRPGYVRTMWCHRDRGEVLLASRYVRGACAEMGMLRRIASRALNWAYRKALSLPFRDISSGFRLYRRDVLDDLGPLRSRGLDALPELIVKAYSQGWRVAEVPFWYQGSRPWTRARMLRMGLGYLRTLGGLFTLRNSVRAADYDHRAFDSWIPLQRYWQRRRFHIIRTLVDDAGLVLDIGCGSSRIVQTLPNVVGVDVALRKLRWLRSPGRHLVQGDMNRLPFPTGVFDAVISSEVIEHVPAEDLRLEELVRMLRPGGVLVLGTPDYSRRLWRALEWLYGKLFRGGYADEHVNHHTYAGLRRELEERLGLDVLEHHYVGGSEMIFKARLPVGSTAARAAS